MKSILLFITIFLFGDVANSQTYIQNGETTITSKVKVKYNSNKGGNRPFLSIEYNDGFDLFNHVMPTCEGAYDWCLRNSNFEDISYLKLDFSPDKRNMILDVKYAPLLNKQPDKNNIIVHLNLLKGTFKRSQ